ncbi:hypothetical protein [Bacteroides zhangwenhongii]|nr:hypothetical protein [Bacteroides zhangwenhongii]
MKTYGQTDFKDGPGENRIETSYELNKYMTVLWQKGGAPITIC